MNYKIIKYLSFCLLFLNISVGIQSIACAQSSSDKSQPNIIYIMSDDHNTASIGAYNGRYAKLNPTPNIDKLADQGIKFTNTFVTNSICTPSRATIMTGQYSKKNKVFVLNQPLPAKRQYLSKELNKLGYETAIIGKWHLKTEPSTFDFYEVLPGQGRYVNPRFRKKGAGQWPKNLVTLKGYNSDVITDEAMKWISSRKNKDKPFYLSVHFKGPHAPWIPADRNSDWLKNEDVPEPKSLYEYEQEGQEGEVKKYSFYRNGSVATKGVNDSLASTIGTSIGRRNKYRRIDRWLHLNIDSTVSDREYKHREYQEFAKRYLRTAKSIDDDLKEFFEYLKKEGLWENTLIIYTADQGEMLGSHDYMDKRWMYEDSINMPLIIRYPKMIKPGLVSDALINNTDFAPTIIDLAGGSVPDYMQGRSFEPILKTGKEPDDWRDATYYRYWMHMVHHGVPAHFGIRTKRYKLIFFYGLRYDPEVLSAARARPFPVGPTPPGWEFYDLKKDPKEMENHYKDPAYQDVIKRLKKKLKAVREKYDLTDEDYPNIQKVIEENWNK